MSRTIRVDNEVAAWLKAEQKRTGKTPSEIIAGLLRPTPNRTNHG